MAHNLLIPWLHSLFPAAVATFRLAAAIIVGVSTVVPLAATPGNCDSSDVGSSSRRDYGNRMQRIAIAHAFSRRECCAASQ